LPVYKYLYLEMFIRIEENIISAPIVHTENVHFREAQKTGCLYLSLRLCEDEEKQISPDSTEAKYATLSNLSMIRFYLRGDSILMKEEI